MIQASCLGVYQTDYCCGFLSSLMNNLFLDAINGDQSLFVGREEIEESWRWCDELIDACNQKNIETKPYHAGSWGPPKAELLIEKDGRSWHV